MGVNDGVGKPVPSRVMVGVGVSPFGVTKASASVGVGVGVLVVVGVGVSTVGVGPLAVASSAVDVTCARSLATVGVWVDLSDFKIPMPASLPVADSTGVDIDPAEVGSFPSRRSVNIMEITSRNNNDREA